MAAAIAAARFTVRTRPAAARLAAQAKPGGLPFMTSSRPPPAPCLLRLPVVVMSAGVESLLPLHSATASCRMTSMLSASRGAFGWLSEVMECEIS